MIFVSVNFDLTWSTQIKFTVTGYSVEDYYQISFFCNDIMLHIALLRLLEFLSKVLLHLLGISKILLAVINNLKTLIF